MEVSYSQLDQFSSCPAQWYYKYVMGIESPSTALQMNGSSYHAALEKSYLYKMESGIDLPISDLLKVYRDDLQERLAISKVEGADYDALSAIGENLLVAYHKSGLMQVTNPKLVEYYCKTPLFDDVVLVGRIDMVTTDGVVIDHKTTGSKWKEDRWEKSKQATTYALLLNQKDIHFEYHIAVSYRKPIIQHIEVYKSEQDVEEWKERIRKLVKQMNIVRENNKIIRNRESFFCKEKFCHYYNMCING